MRWTGHTDTSEVLGSFQRVIECFSTDVLNDSHVSMNYLTNIILPCRISISMNSHRRKCRFHWVRIPLKPQRYPSSCN